MSLEHLPDCTLDISGLEIRRVREIDLRPGREAALGLAASDGQEMEMCGVYKVGGRRCNGWCRPEPLGGDWPETTNAVWTFHA